MARGFGCVQDTQDIYGVGITQARTCCCDKPASIIESFQARGETVPGMEYSIVHGPMHTTRLSDDHVVLGALYNSSTTLISTP